MSELKYKDMMICYQEIPTEVCLSFSISNCPYRCPGCHSSYLQQDVGENLYADLLINLRKYDGLITCVLFLGGDMLDSRMDLKRCIAACRKSHVKVAIYSGAEHVDEEIWKLFDYVKEGPYIERLGPINKITTNQRLYRIVDNIKEDITNLFWRKPYES